MDVLRYNVRYRHLTNWKEVNKEENKSHTMCLLDTEDETEVFCIEREPGNYELNGDQEIPFVKFIVKTEQDSKDYSAILEQYYCASWELREDLKEILGSGDGMYDLSLSWDDEDFYLDAVKVLLPRH